MGLAERKAIQAAKDGDYKAFEAKVNTVCGYLPAMEFDWTTLEARPDCVKLVESKKYNSYMFDRVVEMLKAICTDDASKTALRDGLKQIKMIPKAGNLEFNEGILTIHNDLAGNGAYDAKRIQDTLEKGL